MREIKFRAWDGERLRLVWGLGWVDGELDSVHTPKYHGPVEEDVAVMQYTGLKDKNGVEIYEGDIVEIKGHAFEGSIKIDGNYQVGYNEYMELCCGSLLLVRQLPYATVIGNIYEHPHLLEGVGK